MYKKMREWNEGDWDDLIQEWNDLSDDQLELMIDNDIETENVFDKEGSITDWEKNNTLDC